MGEGSEVQANQLASGSGQAVCGGGSRQSNWTDILGSVISGGMPDAIVYSNAALMAPDNAKSALVADPLAGAYTHFIVHPRNRVNVGGVPFNHVETIH